MTLEQEEIEKLLAVYNQNRKMGFRSKSAEDRRLMGQKSGCKPEEVELVREIITGETFIDSAKIAEDLEISATRVGCAISRIGGFRKWSKRSTTWASDEWWERQE